MTDKERIKYLEGLVSEEVNIDDKYWNNFNKYAIYMGNGVYQIFGVGKYEVSVSNQHNNCWLEMYYDGSSYIAVNMSRIFNFFTI